VELTMNDSFSLVFIIPFSLFVERGNFRSENLQGEHVWCRVAISWTLKQLHGCAPIMKLFVPLEFISRNGHLGIPSWVNATASEFQN
jgi:hypothetical protein